MGRLIDETDLMNLLYALNDARYDLSYAIQKIPELPTVEAIPKAEYETRLKADLEAILVELQLEIEEKHREEEFMNDWNNGYNSCLVDGYDLIQQKIDKLKGVEE